MDKQRTYVAIDLKSFYASVECMERGLDPLDTNLVVADQSRTNKTICLAVSPSLKSWGIPGRPRLFEVEQKLLEINARRRSQAPGRRYRGKSFSDRELRQDPGLELDLIVAPPQMARYQQVSSQIYKIYLKYVAPEDIHVYSIDEVFMDVTDYLSAWGLSARELTMKIIMDVLENTGMTATAGIGSNLYLCKVAMDIGAKHIAADEHGVRIAELDEMSYRRSLWDHRPLTDFWRLGPGYARKLEAQGLYTMGDVARCSLGAPGQYYSEELLYRLFGVNAQLLIDHAWGWEPCTMKDIKAYRPKVNSLSFGQVLQEPYENGKALLVLREMVELAALDLVEKGLVTDRLSIAVAYDVENLADPRRRRAYEGPVTVDAYGRTVPKAAHGSSSLERPLSSTRLLIRAAEDIFKRVTDERLLVRRLTLNVENVQPEEKADEKPCFRQFDMFSDTVEQERRELEGERRLARERRIQETMIAVKRKYGKNALLKAMDLQEGATAIERNAQIGGHRA